ncbi:MAG: IS1380 family transposase [Bifidobacteriaceae bacterium]|jgi:hypothetical protein|nr:IS1380 family transposase [Bifidobacteriaceae bacterium]
MILGRSTFVVSETTGFYPVPRAGIADIRAVGHGGGALLTSTVMATGLDVAMSQALGPWHKTWAVHDPGKILIDLALTLALGGDCLADAAVVRGEPGVYGPVASNPVISRLIAGLGQDADRAVRAISQARATARARVWGLAGQNAPGWQASATDPVVVDLDATLVGAHSEKENAAPTWKKGFGFHPLLAALDHGQGGSGEIVAVMLRAGNAGSNTASDHVQITRRAVAGLPGMGRRPGKKVLVRADSAGGTHEFVAWLTGQGLSYSVGFTLPFGTPELYRLVPEQVWTPAVDGDGGLRDGADVAEFTDLLDLDRWPEGMRVIVRRERPHPGAQLRFGDVDGYRLTAFATNTRRGQLPQLELRHRRRARCEDRIRCAKDTGLRNLPLQGFGQNQVWCQIVALAVDLLAWMGMLALAGHQARRWEPKRLRWRLFTIPATLARRASLTHLRLAAHHPWAHLLAEALARLRPLALSPAT